MSASTRIPAKLLANPRNARIAIFGTMLIGATILFPSMAAAGGNVGWSVSIGGPGFAVSAGQPAYGLGYAASAHVGAPYRPRVGPYLRPYYGPVVYAPQVFYAPSYAPVVAPLPYPVALPRPVVYARPVAVPVRRHLPMVHPVAPHPYRY